MSHDTRTFKAEFRAVSGSKGRQFWAMPLAYEVVDSFGSIWTRGVFDESVTEKFPALMWGHAGWRDIAQMMGGGIDYRDTNGGPEILYELLAEDEQPNTRILAGLMKERESGPAFVRDMSVGFERWTWDGPGGERALSEADREMRDRRGRPAFERIRTAGWDESSVVVAGAVPGAKALEGARMLAVRSVRGVGTVDADTLVEIARRKAAGELTEDEAQAALALAAGESPEPTVDPDDAVDVDEALAEADAALEGLEV